MIEVESFAGPSRLYKVLISYVVVTYSEHGIGISLGLGEVWFSGYME